MSSMIIKYTNSFAHQNDVSFQNLFIVIIIILNPTHFINDTPTSLSLFSHSHFMTKNNMTWKRK